MEKIPRDPKADGTEMDLDECEKYVKKISAFLDREEVPALIGINALTNVLVNTMINLGAERENVLSYFEQFYDGSIEAMNGKNENS